MAENEDFYENDWGNKKSEYYERNKNKNDDENYIEEEEEAIKIQQAKLKKLREVNLLDSEDEEEDKVVKVNKVDIYDLNSSESEDSDDGITKGKKKSQKAKKAKTMRIDTKEDKDEIVQILKNIKIHISEIEENVKPVKEILKDQAKLKVNQTQEYLENKEKVHLLYTIYMLFYIYYKNQTKISEHHPVFKKMFYLKTLIESMKPVDESVFQEIDKILKLLEAKQIMEEDNRDDSADENADDSSNNIFLNKKRAKDVASENMLRISQIKSQQAEKERKKKQNLVEEIDYKNEMGQRLANEQILKARGIYRKRKKWQGNTKLHLREKYTKKQKERKNMVRLYEGKPEVYGGEITGIRRDLVRSTKFK